MDNNRHSFDNSADSLTPFLENTQSCVSKHSRRLSTTRETDEDLEATKEQDEYLLHRSTTSFRQILRETAYAIFVFSAGVAAGFLIFSQNYQNVHRLDQSLETITTNVNATSPSAGSQIQIPAENKSDSQIPDAHIAPDIPLQLKFFDSDDRFLGPPTPATDANWQSLLPLGRGFVQILHGINTTAQHRLQRKKPSIPSTVKDSTNTTSKNRYSVAAFHQYHCVHLIQRYFHRADTASTNKDHKHDGEASPKALTPHERKHAYHCIEYIRQAVMCHADPSLDAVDDDPKDEGRGTNSGWGDTHVCRDFGALRRWTEESRYTDAAFPHDF